MQNGFSTSVLSFVCSLSLLLAAFQFTVCSLTKQDGSAMAQVAGAMAEEEQTDSETEKLIELSEFVVPDATPEVSGEPLTAGAHRQARLFQYLMEEVSSPPPEV